MTLKVIQEHVHVLDSILERLITPLDFIKEELALEATRYL